jgi:DNA-directed RNA polymerase subunit RPC12/RpoP
MPIEFACPRCRAQIRVADSSAGQSGRCPRCRARISIPWATQPKAGSAAQAAPADENPPAAEPFALGSVDGGSVAGGSGPSHSFPAPQSVLSNRGQHADHDAEVETQAVIEAEVGSFLRDLPGVGDAPSAPAGPRQPSTTSPVLQPPLPIGPAAVTVTPASRFLKQTRPQPSRWIIPILCCVAMVAAGGAIWWLNSQPIGLSGRVTATVLHDLELPPALVPVSDIPGPRRQVTEALTELARTAVPLKSRSMEVLLRGRPEGIEVTLQRGPDAVWYRVDPQSSEALSRYLSDEVVNLDEARRKALSTAAGQFLQRYREVRLEQAPVTSLVDFRNPLGFTALVRGLGHQVVAAVGTTAYPCVAEDRDGRLLFLMPHGLKSFRLQGRELDERIGRFPGRLTVTVEASPAADASSAIETSSSDDQSPTREGPAPEATDATTEPSADPPADPAPPDPMPEEPSPAEPETSPVNSAP